MEHMEESVDNIMKEFRSNGKDVDYVELELGAIELDRYAPDARSLIIGLLHDTGLDPDMKIVRPPSKTPPHLSTSTVNLMKQIVAGQLPHGWNKSLPQQLPLPLQGGTPSPAPYVVALTQSMSQLTLSDRAPSFFTSHPVSRPIFGTGVTLKQGFVDPSQPRFWKWDCCAFSAVDPSTHHVAVYPGTPVKSLETPVVAVNSSEKLNEGGLFFKRLSRGCSENEGSSEEDISEDSGNFTGGDMSPGSEFSPTFSPGAERDSPSYASVLNTPATNHSDDIGEPMQTYPAVSPDTPKSHLSEGLRAPLWNPKKLRRLSDAASSEDSHSHRIKECVFCKTNGETPSLYRGHVLKDDQGRTVCHVLQKYVCPICGETGENAHTVKYCPKNSNPPAVSMMTTLKSMRSATGNVRMMSNLRRSRLTSKRHPKKSPAASYAVA